MLVYQLHTRIFQIENGGPFVFPNTATVELTLAPGSTFGSDDAPSRTIVRAHAAKVTFNANTGKWVGKSDPPLERLDILLKMPDGHFHLDGNQLRHEFPCESLQELEWALIGLKWVLPPLLNLEFRDPPIVLHVRGMVGDTSFRWEHKPEEWHITIRPVTLDALEQHVEWSFDKLPLFSGIQNRRLVAATCYFHTACRLIVCGDSPWEFMSEAVLNFAKCLEILFVRSRDTSRDDVRSALSSLGYSPEEIDGDFIPILILRNEVDVGHPRVSLFKPRDLQVLYRYMHDAEDRFRVMLKRLINAVKAGQFALRQSDDLRLSPRDRRSMDRLVETMDSRNRKCPTAE